ncbi:hypothetical protein [Marinovum algicola]|uniref:hypothetical protein n=1 Tax=Marinovum algicola TaxID=42444 RepID=UPI003B51F606
MTPAATALTTASELRRAHGILADVAHHSDADIAAACLTIRNSSSNEKECAWAGDMLALIEGERA